MCLKFTLGPQCSSCVAVHAADTSTVYNVYQPFTSHGSIVSIISYDRRLKSIVLFHDCPPSSSEQQTNHSFETFLLM